MTGDRKADVQRDQPTCYLLYVHIQLKLSSDQGAVLLTRLPAVTAAEPLSGWRDTAQADVTELHIFSEEEPAVCGHREEAPQTAPRQTHTVTNGKLQTTWWTTYDFDVLYWKLSL